MKVLMVHNSYLQPGGEDVVFEQEQRLLRQNGDQVVPFHRHNTDGTGGVFRKMSVARDALWALESARQISEIVIREQPDVAHFHNWFWAISPACYYACRAHGVPVVQTLHNYRLICPSADLFRNGRICESCVGKVVAWPGVLRGCYHSSTAHTALVAATVAAHHWWKTWQNQVDVYIAPSDCVRRKLVQGGFPAEKILLKPNFVDPDPGYREVGSSGYAILAGRLSREKGAALLVEAWQQISELPLFVAGAGPEAERLLNIIQSASLKNVKLLGPQPRHELLRLLKAASFLVFPSQWDEAFGLAVVEAFACGVPVIATRIGAMPELIDDRRTGLLFAPGNLNDLVKTIKWAIGHPEEMEAIRRAARTEYECRFSATVNYPLLRGMYDRAIRAFTATSEVRGRELIVTGRGDVSL